jgi:hypothetical protein
LQIGKKIQRQLDAVPEKQTAGLEKIALSYPYHYKPAPLEWNHACGQQQHQSYKGNPLKRLMFAV